MSNKNKTLISETLTRAVSSHQKGELVAAKSLYQKYLKIKKNDAEAHHLIGLLYLQQGHLDKSLKHQKRAQFINPREYRYLNYLSELLINKGDLKSLIKLSEQQAVKQIADLKFWLGLSKLQVTHKQYDAAVDIYKQLVLNKESAWEAWLDFGNCNFQMGKLNEALACYQRVTEIVPEQIDALNNTGAIYLENEKLLDAKGYFQQVVKVSPVHSVAWYNLASISHKSSQWIEGLEQVKKAQKINPNYLLAQLLEAKLLRKIGDFESAGKIYEHLLESKIEVVGLHNDVGNMYFELKQFETASQFFNEAVARSPQLIDAQFNLGVSLVQLRQFDSARSILLKVLDQNPDYFQAVAPLLHSSRQCCLWKDIDIYSRQLRELLVSEKMVDIAPFSLITLEDSSCEEQIAIAKYWTKIKRQEQSLSPDNTKKLQALPASHNQMISDKLGTKKVKIGYFSADFHEHATSYLLVRVLELHDRSKFEVIAFSYGADDGKDMRQRVINAVDSFVDIQRHTNEQMVETIQSFHLDILIDLKGFTQNSRSEVLLNRLAKYHINFLGYPATMGSELVDYVIVDDYIVNSHEEQFDENILKLPNSYQPTDNTKIIELPPSREQLCLPEDKFVFAAFHQSYKLTESILECWCNILVSNQDSVLWMLINNDTARRQVLQFCEQKGVSNKRIIFAEKVPQSEHLARIQQADLVLDSYPVNGHTSTSDALWANVPVITCSGNTFISRVAGSLLTALNLHELICDGFEDYERLALELSRNENSYRSLMLKLKCSKQSAALFNTERYTLDLESIYEGVISK